MEISLADERAIVLNESLSLDQAEGRAWSKKSEAFGSLVKLTSLLQKPRDGEFELLVREHRYQPFWHILCQADYLYERSREYAVSAGGPEVGSVTIAEKTYPVTGGNFALPGVEHCEEHLKKEALIDAYTGQETPGLAAYIGKPATEILPEYLDDFKPEGAIVVPPQGRASAVVRDTVIGVIKSIRADRILEDRVTISKIDLYYRPVYAFHYRWTAKDRDTVIEIDGVTGAMVSGGKTFQQYVGKFLDPEFLFDVGLDTVDLLVPGGGLAVKLARRGIEAAKKKN
ncbi:MAG TPA: hypothetical protein VMN57_08110 [Anaerolineales bacterium]|nr:hypothetical protein [Anaerolineales bacterium]